MVKASLLSKLTDKTKCCLASSYQTLARNMAYFLPPILGCCIAYSTRYPCLVLTRCRQGTWHVSCHQYLVVAWHIQRGTSALFLPDVGKEHVIFHRVKTLCFNCNKIRIEEAESRAAFRGGASRLFGPP